jgi:sulfite reductase (ferredoxin)
MVWFYETELFSYVQVRQYRMEKRAKLTDTKDKTPSPSVDKFKDYRGLACPINFVKVKLDLAAMKAGETLEVLLDDGLPIENVPGSVKELGDLVLEKKKIDNYWSVIIQKN